MMPEWLLRFLPHISGGLLVALALTLGWAMRIDHLRAKHLRTVATLTAKLDEVNSTTERMVVWVKARNAAVQEAQAKAIEQEAQKYEKDLADARADFAKRLRDNPKAHCSLPGGQSTITADIPVLSTDPVPAGGNAIVSQHDAQLGLDNSLRLQALINAWNAAKAKWDEKAAEVIAP